MTQSETQTLTDQPEPIKHRYRRRRRRFKKLRRLIRRINWWIVLGGVIAVITVLAMSLLVIATDAANQVQDSWDSLDRVLNTLNSRTGTELTLTDFERLQTSMHSMIRSINNAKQRTGFIRPFASVNTDIDATLTALDVAQQLVFATNDMLNGVQPALFFLASGEEDDSVVAQVSSGERVVELLSLGRGRFLSAAEELDNAQAMIAAMGLGDVSPNLLLAVRELTEYRDQLDQLNQILLNGPDLLTAALGLQETQSYLILSQNSDEIRPSGGFISTYGWMNVRNARVAEYDYRPSTRTTPNPPPFEMVDEIEIPDWWLRFNPPIYAAWDGGWTPDFPTSAELAAWFYDEGDNPFAPVDGVIAIDIVAFEYLLEGLGEVVVPDYDEIITASNFRERVYAIRADQEGHKEFIAALYKQILEDWQSIDQERGTEMLGATLKALQEGHIMLYFRDDQLNDAVNLLGWAGVQEPGLEHDYIMVADTNIGSKSSRSVLRQITYDVQIENDDSLESRLTISYDFPEQVAEQDPAIAPEHYTTLDYHNLMQAFVPSDVIFVDTNLRAPPREVPTDTHTIFTTLTEVDYNDSERLQFSYTTPDLIENFGPYHRYRLLIEKQPGLLHESVSVQVALPEGAQLVSAEPVPVTSYDLERPILEFRFNLVLSEVWLELIYTLPE